MSTNAVSLFASRLDRFDLTEKHKVLNFRSQYFDEIVWIISLIYYYFNLFIGCIRNNSFDFIRLLTKQSWCSWNYDWNFLPNSVVLLWIEWFHWKGNQWRWQQRWNIWFKQRRHLIFIRISVTLFCLCTTWDRGFQRPVCLRGHLLKINVIISNLIHNGFDFRILTFDYSE